MANNVFGIGLTDIKLRILNVNGETVSAASANPFTGASAAVSIGEVMEGSTQIVDETPTETKFKGDYSDATLMTLFQRGDFTVETDIISVDGAKFAFLTGGTWNAATKTVTVPASAPVIEGQLVMVFDQGVSSLKFDRCQITANYAGANLKNELFKLHLKVVAQADVDGNVASLILK